MDTPVTRSRRPRYSLNLSGPVLGSEHPDRRDSNIRHLNIVNPSVELVSSGNSRDRSNQRIRLTGERHFGLHAPAMQILK